MKTKTINTVEMASEINELHLEYSKQDMYDVLRDYLDRYLGTNQDEGLIEAKIVIENN